MNLFIQRISTCTGYTLSVSDKRMPGKTKNPGKNLSPRFLSAARFTPVLSGIIILLAGLQPVHAQDISTIINQQEVTRIESVLSSDSMEGRKTFTPGIDKAAEFIANEFKKAGLQPFSGSSMLQEFTYKDRPLANVVGILPGKSKKDEYVIFSGHYDHLGITSKPVNGDSVFNGANDDAAGTTAVIMLANYFSRLKQNERTLVFVAFTAEEIGGFGSSYFSKQLPPEKVMAMFNIEMIGTDSKWGKNSAYITGYEKSDMGKILEKNLEGTEFRFYPDPYPEQQLFYRSDNATLARLGVPAHTISTSKMDNEPYYHSVGDQVETLDMENMTRIIQAIAMSSRSIVEGKDTPSRVEAASLRKKPGLN